MTGEQNRQNLQQGAHGRLRRIKSVIGAQLQRERTLTRRQRITRRAINLRLCKRLLVRLCVCEALKHLCRVIRKHTGVLVAEATHQRAIIEHLISIGRQSLQVTGVRKRQRGTINRQKVRGVVRVASLLLGADCGNQRLILVQQSAHTQRRQAQNNSAPVQGSLKVKALAGLQLAFFNQQVCALINPVHEDPAGELDALAVCRIPDEGGGLLAAELFKEAVQSCGHGGAGGGESNHGFHSTAPCGGAREEADAGVKDTGVK